MWASPEPYNPSTTLANKANLWPVAWRVGGECCRVSDMRSKPFTDRSTMMAGTGTGSASAALVEWGRPANLSLSVSFNLQLIIRTSGSNPAIAYGSGLYGYWGIMNSLTMLVWTRPQFDAARIVKVESEAMKKKGEKDGGAHVSGVNGAHCKPLAERGENGSAYSSRPNVSVVQAEKGYTYYWEPYPINAPFRRRMELGHRYCSSPPRPRFQEPYERVKLEDIPKTAQAGYTRHDTAKEYLYDNLKLFATSYILLDAMSTYMPLDPFFVVGPNTLPLPHVLQALPNLLVDFLRNLLVLISVWRVVLLVLSYLDILQYFIGGYFYPIRREAWQHPSVFGSFTPVLDRGLAGFWGGWWHQTFRMPFTAPVSWLVAEGHLPARAELTNILKVLSAFLNSGLLHACGSYTTFAPTKLYHAPLFFAFSALGIYVQQAACVRLAPVLTRLPKAVRQCGNLLFTVLWLWATCWPLAYDFGTAGLWLFEPVPISLFKGLGLGADGESWWRWHDYLLTWHSGKHWWQTGLALGA
ncbi:unnamed protein product [Parascedosporium putredinis]|uniref:Wax synthase domain-containing protein n=1 Tax=Parascedosporium putredinis TaxID=1442378 RepID=A0A9P1H6B5_9PEZI|nr:unnamed protein product [Parascedosporium putredinis]CAI7998526.1 unnamed protein product [Parascedosporium putredinis]